MNTQPHNTSLLLACLGVPLIVPIGTALTTLTHLYNNDPSYSGNKWPFNPHPCLAGKLDREKQDKWSYFSA